MSNLIRGRSVRWRLGVVLGLLAAVLLYAFYYTAITSQETAQDAQEINAVSQLGETVLGIQLLASRTISATNRQATLDQITQSMDQLDAYISALLDGDSSLGFFGLRRHSDPQIIATYNAIVGAKNNFRVNVRQFVDTANVADSTVMVPVIQSSSNSVYNTISDLQELLTSEAQSQTQNILHVFTIIALILALIVIVGVITTYRIIRSLSALNRTATKLAEGEFSVRIAKPGHDEIGQIAVAMNTLAEELEAQIGSLEARISVRTRDLQAVADVNRQISTVLDVDRLLQDVVDLTKERFRLYHAHIYLLNEPGDTLILSAGAGHVGRQMVSEVRTIVKDNQQSVAARAAYTRRPIVVNDVTTSAVFLPHPLLPDTKSELAVPLAARGKLLGVLDVQADQIDFFSADSVQVFELMAGQVAAALNNASLYESAERTSRHERALGNIDRRIQGAVGVDEVLQVTVRELGKALRVPHTVIELQLDGQSADAETN